MPVTYKQGNQILDKVNTCMFQKEKCFINSVKTFEIKLSRKVLDVSVKI